MKRPCPSAVESAIFCCVRGAVSGSVDDAEPDGGRSKQATVEALHHGGAVFRGPSSTSRIFHRHIRWFDSFPSLASTPSLPLLRLLLFHLTMILHHSRDPTTHM
jgi:hypothetical protein